MSQDQGGADVPRVEQVLERHDIRPVPRQQLGQSAVHDQQLFRKGYARGHGDGTAVDDVVPAALRLDAAVAGTPGAGVHPEYSHANDASISFASMSKFDQTCCTSSWSSSTSISFRI